MRNSVLLLFKFVQHLFLSNLNRRCLCSETHRWDGALLNCTPVNGTAKPDEGGHTMQNGRSDVRKKQWILTVGVIVATLIVLFIIVYFFCQRKKTQTQEKAFNKIWLFVSMTVQGT
ncbi:hypothetical protein Patl1_02119 [Pistacia atlantica]|uniref:Uncharacterized protein n=1 Tax=Pistacia atlantica TaxID=434234 RepID=A0ACC1CDZ2_9ROSI|nr:hypothetical protein Patl1_02119 [Pistacia atlantica]